MIPSENTQDKLDFIQYQITQLKDLRIDNLCCILATLYEIQPESARQADSAIRYRRILVQRLTEIIIFTDVVAYN